MSKTKKKTTQAPSPNCERAPPEGPRSRAPTRASGIFGERLGISTSSASNSSGAVRWEGPGDSTREIQAESHPADPRTRGPGSEETSDRFRGCPVAPTSEVLGWLLAATRHFLVPFTHGMVATILLRPFSVHLLGRKTSHCKIL